MSGPDTVDRPLRGVAARGVALQGLSFGIGKVLTLLTTLVLARLLTPSEFGLVTIALVPVTYIDLVADLGIAHAIVYLPRSRARLDAALVLGLLAAAVLTVAMVLAAPAVAGFFDRPDATPLLRALAAIFLLRAVGQIPDALLRQELRFRARLGTEAVRASVQTVVTVALAAMGLGAWAIALGVLAGHLAWSIAGWRVVDHRPRWRVGDLRDVNVRPLLRYGLPSAGNAFLLALVYDLDYLIVGRVLGAEALGYYAMAFKIPQALIITVFHAMSTVAFPVMVRIREDPPRLAHAYRTWMRIQTLYGAAAGTGLALVAPVLVPVLLGDRWLAVVPALQGLAVYASLRSMSSGAFDLYKAVGRPGLALRLSVVRLAMVAPVLLLVVGQGIEAVAWAQAAVAGAMVVLMQAVACRVLRIRATAFLRSVAPAVGAAAATAAAVLSVRALVPGTSLSALALAALAGALAALVVARVATPGLLAALRSSRAQPVAVDPRAEPLPERRAG